MIGNQKNNEKFDVLGTKISPEMSEVLNTICDAMQVDVYHLLQWFVYTLIRASSPQHELTPEIPQADDHARSRHRLAERLQPGQPQGAAGGTAHHDTGAGRPQGLRCCDD